MSGKEKFKDAPNHYLEFALEPQGIHVDPENAP